MVMLGVAPWGCAADRFLDAVDRGDAAAVKAMLAEDPQLAQSKWTGRRGGVIQRPLVKAAGEGHLEIVRALLDNGADPNAPGANEETALHAAALFPEHTAILDLLLQRGARPEPRDVALSTPMHRPAEALDGEPALRLLARGASVTVVNQFGDTPLHLAAASARIHTAAVLCGAGADPKALDAKGQTPQSRAHARPERMLAVRAWFDPVTGECARLALLAAPGKPAPEVARRAAAAAYECLQMQQEQPDPQFPKRRPNQASWCGVLGYAQENGTGVAKDEKRAFVSYRLACDNGEIDSCTRAGVLLEDGRGTVRDPLAAAGSYEQACAASDLWGCSRLGHLRERGVGGPKDERRAAALYEQACAGKRGWSCRRLARLYAKGAGVVQDVTKAAELDAQACELGEKDSCTRTPTR